MLSCPASGPSAATDSDATVFGHLPNELPHSAALTDAEADEVDLYETDERQEGDHAGNGIPDPDNEDDGDIALHLRGDKDKTSLGDPPEEDPARHLGEDLETEALNRAIKRYLLQEYPAGAGVVNPVGAKGFYSDFDMAADHGDGSKIQATDWYRSDGQAPGTAGDTYRQDDPNVQLGFHSPVGPKDSTLHPSVSGEEGNAARKTPAIWSLSAGGNTGEVLATNVKKSGSDSGGETHTTDTSGSEANDGQLVGADPGAGSKPTAHEKAEDDVKNR